MNLIAFGLILICCHAWAIEIDGTFGGTYASRTKLEKFLESFKSSLQEGFEKYNIPPLDPFIGKDEIPVKIDRSTIKLDALFKEVNVTGLSNYEVKSADLKLSLIKMYAKVNLNWPLVIAITNYSGTSNFLDLYEIYGNGNIIAAVHNCHYESQINLVMKGLHVQVKEIVSTKISLEALNFSATGLYNSDDETSEKHSKVISEMVPVLINKNQGDIQSIVNGIIKEFLNKFLYTMTLQDLLKLLGM